MFGTLIIIGVIFFGGFIALLGDRVGTKVGKKRLSVFGLRPKHTSMVITVLTGFFIAALTLLILTLMSEYARTAIFELQTIEERLKNATLKVTTLTQQVITKEKEITVKEREVAKAENDYRELTNKYLTLEQHLNAVTTQSIQVQQELSDAQIQYQKAVSNLSTKQIDLDLAQQRLDGLMNVNEDLKDQMNELGLQKIRLNQQIQNLETSRRILEDKNRNIVDKPVIFYVDEILTARVVNPGGNADYFFKEIITPLLKQADNKAYQRGARIIGKNISTRIMPESALGASKKLAGLKVAAVLRVVVEKNSVSGEPVMLALEVYPNQLMFKDKEALVSADLTGITLETELRNQLLGLMILGINKAVGAGIITDDQNFRDLISLSEMNNVISEIKENNEAHYKASLVAVGDIYRINHLKVKFKLERQK